MRISDWSSDVCSSDLCCHCRWCQRETGSAFALNAMIESDRMTLLSGAPEIVDTPSNSAGPVILFVRIGTLDDPDLLRPDIHIFTASKQPWSVIPPAARAMPEYYEIGRAHV